MSAISRLAFYSSHSHIPKGRLPFDLSLYLVANRPSFQDENLFFSKIMASVKGGVSCVQLRDHKSDFATTLKTATHLKNMLRGVPLFINTLKPFEVVQAIGADGIYLEEQFSHSEARKLLGKKVIIGVPVKTMEEVLAIGQTSEIDYLSVKISPSKRTCPRNDQLWGMEGLRSIRSTLRHRIVAIGGLNLECAESVYRELHLDDGVAMAGGLMEESDPCITAQKIQAIRQRIRGGS
jgi:thiamine-phosphate pyrophosphorylase